MDESVSNFLNQTNNNAAEQYLNAELPGAPKFPTPEKDEGPKENDYNEENNEEEHAPRNRRERRARASQWEERLQQRERELIEQEARIKAAQEVAAQNAPKEVPDEWLRMYGDTAESRAAWGLQERLNNQTAERLRAEIRAEMENERYAEQQEARMVEEGRAEALELMEDQYSIDMTSNSPAARKASRLYLKALEDVADDDGQADPYVAYELYQYRRNQETDNSKNKQLADRAIAPTGETDRSKADDDQMRSYLRSQGIRV